MPHLANELQWSVHNVWSCILCNPYGAVLWAFRVKELATFVDRYARDISVTASWTVAIYFIFETAKKCS